MKRLLTYLFLVIGVGLIFSGSTLAKEKVSFCAKDGDYWKGVVRISTIPCSKIIISSGYKKWKKIIYTSSRWGCKFIRGYCYYEKRNCKIITKSKPKICYNVF